MGSSNRNMLDRRKPYLWLALTACLALAETLDAQGPAIPTTGPQTEKRFPALVVPAGFKATLFACDPLVEYPSVIALGPRPGSVLVAYDYLTGLGTDITRRDEIRIVQDSNGDGYADTTTLFAEGFNSIQGLAQHRGTVYVMHAPLLTALRDADGDGRADERRDLLTGLGLTPEKNSTRLHCANGVVPGHDGWLYLAVGDNGIDVPRPEGDRLVLHAGGILRCRTDGRDLHVFSSGLRNIYDVALDDELNVFVRDNENDGGDYMIRVCHSFHGADHGYPYLYAERPGEAVAPLADLGRGSSAGGACYLETAFPREFRGNLFFCEWGKSIVRYERRRTHAGFAPTQEVEFATGAATDPYGFKPTDIIVDHDGSLLVSDWGDGQRPKRGRGRIYRIAPAVETKVSPPVLTEKADLPALLVQLDSPGSYARIAAQSALEDRRAEGLAAVNEALRKKSVGPVGRMHAVWILAMVGGQASLPDLFVLAESDADLRVRAQAVRAIADLADPSFGASAESARRGAAETTARLARLANNADPRVVFEVVVALGRLRCPGAPAWLHETFRSPPLRVALDVDNSLLSHAAMQTLRRADNWSAVLTLLDDPEDRPVRNLALIALANRADTLVVDGLIRRLRSEQRPGRRRDYADALARVYKLPAAWTTYWGYRPPPRPANTETWERTDPIEVALDGILQDPDREMRSAILQRMRREAVPVRIGTLSRWLREERAVQRVQVILESLPKPLTDESRALVAEVILQREYVVDNRSAALSLFVAGLANENQRRLLELAEQVEDGPVLVNLLAELSRRPDLPSGPLLLRKLQSTAGDVRAAAMSAAADLKVNDAIARIPTLLQDPDLRVRRAAALAAGMLEAKAAVPALLSLSRDADPAIRSHILDSLRQLREPSAIAAAVAGLEQSVTQLAAVEYLAEFGGPDQAAAVTGVTATNTSGEIVSAVVRALTLWETRPSLAVSPRQELARSVAGIQGRSGMLRQWHLVGPLSAKEAAEWIDKHPSELGTLAGSKTLLASGADGRVELGADTANPADMVWLAATDIVSDDETRVQFLSSSNTPFQVWLNGKSVYRREQGGTYQPDSDRFEGSLTKGLNRLVVQLKPTGAPQFHVHFRKLSSSAEHEKLTQFALQTPGDAERGRALFLNIEKSHCLKCHRLQGQGGSIGPDLTGVGGRFSRIHLIESILEPSRTIAPSYETVTILLNTGKTVTGVKAAEDATTLTVGDETGKRHEILQADIEDRGTQRRSTMPDGLEKRFTEREFVDLLAFLGKSSSSQAAR